MLHVYKWMLRFRFPRWSPSWKCRAFLWCYFCEIVIFSKNTIILLLNFEFANCAPAKWNERTVIVNIGTIELIAIWKQVCRLLFHLHLSQLGFNVSVNFKVSILYAMCTITKCVLHFPQFYTIIYNLQQINRFKHLTGKKHILWKNQHLNDGIH